MKVLRWIAKVTLGFIVITIPSGLYLSVINGSIGDGFSILFSIYFFATVCTIGAGGIVIILISYAVGHFVFKLLGLNPPKENVTAVKNTIVGFQDSKQIALTQYIIRSRGNSVSDTNIIANLLEVGWARDQIQSAFDATVIRKPIHSP